MKIALKFSGNFHIEIFHNFHCVKIVYIVGYFYTGPNPQVSDKM